VGDVSLRLVRRVVEIRDGRLALRDYLPAGTLAAVHSAAEQAGLTSLDAQVTVEAACLAVALVQRRCGDVPNARDPLPAAPGGTDLDEEVAYLMRVARAYTSSPTVRAARNGGRTASASVERVIA
jgi:hypothetical protein